MRVIFIDMYWFKLHVRLSGIKTNVMESTRFINKKNEQGDVACNKNILK